MVVNMHEAKTHFSKLVERVEAGEEIVIARAGRPVARLAPLAPPEQQGLKFGLYAGQMWVADDFDETSEEIIASFEGD